MSTFHGTPLPPPIQTNPRPWYPRTQQDPTGNIPAYEAFNIQFQNAIAQKQQEDQILAQILQAFGYAKNMSPFGAIPHGASILMQNGQAYVRPGGIDKATQDMLFSLLGVRQSAKTGGIQDPRSLEQKGGGIPNYLDYKQRETGLVPYEGDQTEVAKSESINNPNMLEFYMRMYPELWGLLPEQAANSGGFPLQPAGFPIQTRQPITRFTIPMLNRR